MTVAVVLEIIDSVASSIFITLARVVVLFASSVRLIRRGLIGECKVGGLPTFLSRVVFWFVWWLELLLELRLWLWLVMRPAL